MFAEVPVYRIAEGDRAEVCGDPARHVRAAAHRREVHEPDGGDVNRSDPEPQARGLSSLGARSWLPGTGAWVSTRFEPGAGAGSGWGGAASNLRS